MQKKVRLKNKAFLQTNLQFCKMIILTQKTLTQRVNSQYNKYHCKYKIRYLSVISHSSMRY